MSLNNLQYFKQVWEKQNCGMKHNVNLVNYLGFTDTPIIPVVIQSRLKISFQTKKLRKPKVGQFWS